MREALVKRLTAFGIRHRAAMAAAAGAEAADGKEGRGLGYDFRAGLARRAVT